MHTGARNGRGIREGRRPIRLYTNGHRIALPVDAAELEKRRAALPSLPPGAGRRGCARLCFDAVTQAGQGCDFDFAIPEITKKVP